MKKRILMVLMVIGLVCGLTGCATTVDEPCAWCNSSPSKVYELSSGKEMYVCEDCSSTCAYCSGTATKHYESLLGIVFVCNDCYEEVEKLNQ